METVTGCFISVIWELSRPLSNPASSQRSTGNRAESPRLQRFPLIGIMKGSPDMSESQPESPLTRLPPPSDSAARLRSVPYRSPYVWAEVFALINYCGAIALLISLPLFFLNANPASMRVVIGCVIFYCISGTVSFLKRRHVLCPLCKGTPLVSSRALVHSKATRIFPLDYGTSAMLILLFSQTFRCMYCGARFDLLKPRQDIKALREQRQDNLS